MPYDQFRLDGAALEDSTNPFQRIVAHHFNVPVRLASQRSTFDTILQHIQTDFPAEHQHRVAIVSHFQISAVYTLVHRTTGTERLWAGSFNPRSRERGQVTAFRYLDPATFVDFVYPRSQPDFVYRQQQAVADQKDTAWSVGEILSVIISIQTTVRLGHFVLQKYPHLGAGGGQDNGDPEGGGAGAAARQQGRSRRRPVFSLLLE
jgi:hypothetical protein